MQRSGATESFNYMNSLSKYLREIQHEGGIKDKPTKNCQPIRRQPCARKSMEDFDDIEFEIINIKAVLKDKSKKNTGEKTLNQSSFDFQINKTAENGRQRRVNFEMRDSDALYNFTPNICSNLEPKVSNCINGGKYIPTRIQFMVKNESVLIQEDADTNISQNKIKDNNFDLSSFDNAETQDENEYTPHIYSPNRKSYRIRRVIEKKLDYFLQSAERMTSKKRIKRRSQ